jgi:hypothetical protein
MSHPESPGNAAGSTTATATRSPIPHHAFIPDALKGILLGDFAASLGLAGAVMQIIMGFMPGIGTLAALRDCTADLGKKDNFSLLLNVMSLVPVVGGLSKTAEVMSRAAFAGEAFVVARGQMQRRAFKDGQYHHIPKNRLARFSALAALATPLPIVVLPILVFVPAHLLPLWALWFVFALPLLAIILGHLGRRRARRLQKSTPGLEIKPGAVLASTGLTLGYLSIFLLGILAGFVYLAAQAGLLGFLQS